MPKVCEFCGKNPVNPKTLRRKKKLPPHRRRFFPSFFYVYFPAKYGDKILQVCFNCYKGGKMIHIFYPAKPPDKT